MKTIHKFKLPIDDMSCVAMPEGAEILCLQMQHQAPFIWAQIDTEAGLQNRYFRTFGTGHDATETINAGGKYLGTYQAHNGHLVFHVYEMPAYYVEQSKTYNFWNKQ